MQTKMECACQIMLPVIPSWKMPFPSQEFSRFLSDLPVDYDIFGGRGAEAPLAATNTVEAPVACR